jgi:hypothetical protein
MICVATRQTNSGEATVAMLDMWHRPGNVHDSNGARRFVLGCLGEMRQILRAAVLTNAKLCAHKLLQLHNWRGAQEGIFAELKSRNAD